MNATFIRLKWENDARTLASVYLQPEGTYRFEAGQYADVSVPHDNPDNRGISRVMTWSSSPDEPLLKMTFRYYGPGGSSYKRALLGLKPGTPVTIQGAMGDLVLPLDATIPMVWVAGGVGIASFTGMARYLADRQDKRNVTLLYAVAHEGDIIMQDLFDAYQLSKTIYVTRGEKGRKLGTADILSVLTPDTLVYVSGTEAMVETIRHGLEAAGIARSRIIFDYYEGYSELV